MGFVYNYYIQRSTSIGIAFDGFRGYDIPEVVNNSDEKDKIDECITCEKQQNAYADDSNSECSSSKSREF